LLWKIPENLIGCQKSKLADVQKTNEPLYRSYVLKEQLRAFYRVRQARQDDHRAARRDSRCPPLPR